VTVAATIAEAPKARPLDRMDDWTNDDLLLEERARMLLETQHRGALRVFDWPDLRTQFKAIDQRAGQSRKRRRRNGVIAASVTTFGAALSALLPIAEPLGWDVERGVYALAAIISFLGFAATIWLVHGDNEITQWLESRLQTERLRQLYFQFIGSDPALAARAFTDDAAMSELHQRRDEALKAVAPVLLQTPRAVLTATIEDVNQRRVWLLEAFKQKPGPLAPSADLDKVLEILRKQRIGVQADYIREKLAPGIGSPQSWHAFSKGASYVSALGALIASILIALLLFNGATFESLPVRVLVSLIAFIGVIVMFVRLLGEGLQVRADAERYAWYRDAVTDLDARFNNTDPNVRVELLREMECASYREMREFLKTHKQARFSFG
jgi:hypothetical protein